MGRTVIRRVRARLTAAHAGDDGSVLPLAIGYAMLALVAVLVCVDATSLYLAQKKLDGLADAAALAGADGFVITADARAELTDDGVREQAEALVADVGEGARLVEASTPDGTSARVRVADVWRPPVITMFVPDGVRLEARATSRTALH